MFLKSKNIHLDFSKPCIMGVLNVTPDSFFDGGRYNNIDAALLQAEKMVNEGADIIDVGGESTRPFTQKTVSLNEELDRVIPVIEKISANFNIPISIDTSKAIVMREAIRVGADIINDIRSLEGEGALDTAAELQVPVCIMHMQGTPKDMQVDPYYEDVVWEVTKCLEERAAECIKAGILKDNIMIDPGFGFGKKLEHNLALLKNLKHLTKLGFPVLAGVSNKTMIGNMLNVEPKDRLYGSIAANIVAYLNGANILRVHDVLPTVHALKVTHFAIED